jgi:uncharacterized repeat protein (TIGR03803 family)
VNLVFDAQGSLYGTTFNGGMFRLEGCDVNTCGVVFELTPAGTETALHIFAGPPDDGANPAGGVVFDAQGNLYGTTYVGGAYGSGTVFEITNEGVEKVLYSFTGGANGATDGGGPFAGLAIDAQGNLYGTTINGIGSTSNGTVFKLTP